MHLKSTCKLPDSNTSLSNQRVNSGDNKPSAAEKYRKKFIENPPEGFDAEEIKEMDDEAILDMYYFLYEDG